MMKLGLIIGAQKCGTTALNRALRSHVQVASCSTKEPDFFADPAKHQLGAEWYRDLFKAERSHAIAVESSTSYAMFPTYVGVPERMKDTGWQFRFVYIMRNPFDRIRSFYLHAAVENLGTPPLSEGIHSFPIEVSSYHMQIECFRRVFGRESILLIMHGEMRANPAATLHRVFSHFDIENDPKIGMDTVHAGEEHYHRALVIEEWRKRFEVPPDLNRYNLHRHIASLDERARDDIERVVQSKYMLTSDHKATIRRSLSEDMRLLKRDYGVEVERWGFVG